MALVGARAKFFHYNTLACLLTALEGKKVTVEIRNNVTLCGVLDSVASDMSLHMSNVTRTEVGGETTRFSKFYIRSRQIGMVHIPDEVDMVKAITWQLNKTDYFLEKEQKFRTKKFEMKQRQKLESKKRLERQGKL